MAEGLPEGLVKNREGVTAVGEGVDRVEVEQVAACWSGRFLLARTFSIFEG